MPNPNIVILTPPSPDLASLRELINIAIAAIADAMDQDGCSASEIACMRHDLIGTVSTYCPNLFRRQGRQ